MLKCSKVSVITTVHTFTLSSAHANDHAQLLQLDHELFAPPESLFTVNEKAPKIDESYAKCGRFA